MSLDEAILSARQQPLAWTRERSMRVSCGVRAKREARERRARTIWRGLALGSCAAFGLALACFAREPRDARSTETASIHVGDAGYERD